MIVPKNVNKAFPKALLDVRLSDRTSYKLLTHMAESGALDSAWPKTPTFFPPKLAILILTNSVKFPSGGFFGFFSAVFAAFRRFAAWRAGCCRERLSGLRNRAGVPQIP